MARAFTRRGLRVRPFKPQNMSNNAAVTADGGEIGRAQALQARAAPRGDRRVHMNPVLLKPQSEIGAQVVVQGKVFGNATAREIPGAEAEAAARRARKLRTAGSAKPTSCWSKGAGSASEINLRAGDIANMGFARAADVPVVLIGDIDRGGVIASLVGTKAVIDPDDAAMIAGFIVNRFRGDPSLFADGMAEDRRAHRLARRWGWCRSSRARSACRRRTPAGSATRRPPARNGTMQRSPCLCLPRIANFDDLDPLRPEPDVDLVFVRARRADARRRRAGHPAGLEGHHRRPRRAARGRAGTSTSRLIVRRGGHVLGICGGYQMLGRTDRRPERHRGSRPRRSPGLGLLDVETALEGDKVLVEVQAKRSPTAQRSEATRCMWA